MGELLAENVVSVEEGRVVGARPEGRISEWPREVWEVLLQRFGTAAGIATQIGTTGSYAAQCIRRCGLRNVGNEPKLKDVTDEELIRAYKEEGTLAGVGRRYHLGCAAIGEEFARRGLEYDHRKMALSMRQARDRENAFAAAFDELLTLRERQLVKASVLGEHWVGSYMMLVIADLHGFLVRDDMVRLAVEQAAKDKPEGWPLRVVIAGDIMDLQLFSRFLNYDWQCDSKFQTEEEIRKIESLFQYLILKADRVLAVPGNHDWRAYKDLLRKMGKDKTELLLNERPILGWPIGYVNGMDIAPAFYQRLGDVVVGHSEDFSQIPMRTATQFVDWINLHEENPREIRVVVTGHSHHMGMIYYHHKLAIEPGCMCKPADYLYSGRLGAGKKERWYNGYVTIPMEDNKARLNDIRLCELDEL